MIITKIVAVASAVAKIPGASEAISKVADTGIKSAKKAAGNKTIKKEIIELSKSIEENKLKIGNYYLKKYKNKKKVDHAPKYFCEAILEAEEKIHTLKEELKMKKED